MRFAKVTLAILAMAFMAWAAPNQFAGTWKLNVEKAKFSPGTAIQSETVVIGEDGQVQIDETSADGKPISWSYTAVNGKKAEITGMGADSSVVEKMTGNTVHHSWIMAGKPSTGSGVISKDGKTLTYNIKGNTVDGKPMNNVLTFERQ